MVCCGGPRNGSGADLHGLGSRRSAWLRWASSENATWALDVLPCAKQVRWGSFPWRGTSRPPHGRWNLPPRAWASVDFLGLPAGAGLFGRLDRGLSLAARWRGAVSGDAFGSEVGLPSGSGAEGVVVLPPLSSLTVSPLFSPCFLGACLWRLGGGWTGPVWCRRLIFRAVPSRIMPAGLKST